MLNKFLKAALLSTALLFDGVSGAEEAKKPVKPVGRVDDSVLIQLQEPGVIVMLGSKDEGTTITRATGESSVPKAGAVISNVGDKMPDGTVFAGVSPSTGRPLYVLPADAPLKMKFKDAVAYAAQASDGNGRKGFRLPTRNELYLLYQNRDKGALKGSFAEACYWSSNPRDRLKRGQDFRNGKMFGDYFVLGKLQVRCVR